MGTHPWETMSRGVVFVNKSLIMIIKYEMHFSELSKNVLGGEYQRYSDIFGSWFNLGKFFFHGLSLHYATSTSMVSSKHVYQAFGNHFQIIANLIWKSVCRWNASKCLLLRKFQEMAWKALVHSIPTYLVAISMYVCVKGAILGLSHANQVPVKSVPDGPKARKGERQQKAEEIQQGICCANWNHHYYYCVFLLLYYYCVMHSETKSKFLFRHLNCSQSFHISTLI